LLQNTFNSFSLFCLLVFRPPTHTADASSKTKKHVLSPLFTVSWRFDFASCGGWTFLMVLFGVPPSMNFPPLPFPSARRKLFDVPGPRFGSCVRCRCPFSLNFFCYSSFSSSWDLGSLIYSFFSFSTPCGRLVPDRNPSAPDPRGFQAILVDFPF